MATKVYAVRVRGGQGFKTSSGSLVADSSRHSIQVYLGNYLGRYHSLTWTAFRCVISTISSKQSSRPMPDCLYPPHGMPR